MPLSVERLKILNGKLNDLAPQLRHGRGNADIIDLINKAVDGTINDYLDGLAGDQTARQQAVVTRLQTSLAAEQAKLNTLTTIKSSIASKVVSTPVTPTPPVQG